MKIVHTISIRWWNACAYYALTLALQQKKNGHEVYFASVPGYLPTQHAESTGLNVINIDFAAKNPANWLLQRQKFSRFLRDKKIDIINSHSAEDHLLAGGPSKRRGIPIVRFAGDMRVPLKNPFNTHLFHQRTEKIVFSCESNRIRYLSVWPDLEPNCHIIHGGVDRDRFRPRRKDGKLLASLSIDSGKFLIGIIGRFSMLKDHYTFFKAAALLREDFPQVHFIVSGDDAGLKKADLIKFAGALQMLPDITFVDRHEPVTELISLFDLAVIASKDSEAICRIAMEYMAMGIPMVATDTNVLPEIIEHRKNGLIVPGEDAYAMYLAMSELYRDGDLRKKISVQNIKTAADRFDLDVFTAQVEAVYKSLP